MSKKLRDVAIAERATLLGLSPADRAALHNGLALDVADHMIENAIATYALPMGVAENFVINGRDVRIPMAVEEPSVLAACSFAAKLARAGGGMSLDDVSGRIGGGLENISNGLSNTVP